MLSHRISKICFALVLGLGLIFIAMASLVSVQAQTVATSSLVTVQDRNFVRNGTPFSVRGMNYYPKDFAWDRFWLSYTLAITQIERELDEAKSLGFNTVRIFTPHGLFSGTVKTAPYPGYLADFIGRLQARDMVAIVTIFDFYANHATAPYSTTDYLTSTQHISTVINTIGPANPTVMAWDIKNELDRDYAIFGEAQVKAWAMEMISQTRQMDPNHLITIGFFGVTTGTLCYEPAVTNVSVYNPIIAAEFASLVDFVSMHYYLSERCFENDLKALQTLIGNKPLVLEEFGLHTLANPTIPCASNPGDPLCDDPHTEIEQAAYYNAILALSEANGVAGRLFWTLNDFSYVFTNSQQSQACHGILRNSEVGFCAVTNPVNYSQKPATDIVYHHFKDRVFYIDMGNGYPDEDTDLPPLGWEDNWMLGGAIMRGYNNTQTLWSHTPGKIAVSKFVSNSISITGTARSPLLTSVNINRYPFLTGQIFSYSIRDTTFGSNSTLFVGVQEGTQVVRLLTITPGTTLPYTFSLDLRQSPVDWSGNHDFQIILELVAEEGENGFSATYEFDWIALEGYEVIFLPIIFKNSNE